MKRTCAPRLILVAAAVAPGCAGAEALVNAQLIRALAEHWPDGVTVVSGGARPVLDDGTPVSSLTGWHVHALGECGASGDGSPALSRLADWGVRSIRRGGPASLPSRAVQRGLFSLTGIGLKAAAWSRAAARIVARELEKYPDAVVYSRALPFSSLMAADAARLRRRFRWIANLNDPLPPEVWPGQYTVHPRANRRMREGLRAMLPRIDGFTFPSDQLREIEVAAFPEMARAPFEIVRHVAGPPVSALPTEGRTLEVAFAGTLRRDRCRRELGEALALLREREPGAADEIRITFYVPHPMPMAADFAAGLPVRTRVAVGLRAEELRRELAAAGVLFDLESEIDRPLLMTKLADYSVYGKPVWALCAPGGTTWTLLDGWGYRSALGEPESIFKALLRIRDDWRAGRLPERAPGPAVTDLFAPRTQVEALLRLVERIA